MGKKKGFTEYWIGQSESGMGKEKGFTEYWIGQSVRDGEGEGAH
jgi:hypothetical protein